MGEVLIMIQDNKILQIDRITYFLTFPIYFFSLLQEGKFAIMSEEQKNFDEHVDIKHEIKPIFQLSATTEMSEVRQGCECCNFNPHIDIQIIYFQNT
mgnify:CR=1 FL=1